MTALFAAGAATPAFATRLYSGIQAAGDAERVDGPGSTSGAVQGDFGTVLGKAIDGAVQAGRAADDASMRAIAGHGNVTEVVTAVAKAELALQTTVTVRDRVVQAYQDVMRMAI